VLIILLLGLGLAGAATVLMARALAMPRLRASESIGRIESYGFTSKQASDTSRSAARGAVDGVATLLGGAAGRFGGFREASLRRELVAAGIYGLGPRKFLGYRILCAVSMPGAWLWLASTGGYSGAITLLGTPLAVLVGWTLPMTIVRRRSRRRYEQIDFELPNLIDLIVVTVEAGLGFTGSLQLAAERFGGPLGD
jgi:Flp pilus assembly protein TadB